MKSCNDETIAVDGISFSVFDVECLLKESFKFRSIFLEHHNVSLEELNDALGVNKVYDDELKAFEENLKKDETVSSNSLNNENVQHASF